MKIYDCFTFNDELDILKLRISLYWNIVDYFVISESKYTFNGKLKELNAQKYVKENNLDLKKFIFVNYEPTAEMMENLSINRWPLENLARQTLLKGLQEADPKDIVILSDADELPSVEQIDGAKSINEIKALETPMFFRKANHLVMHSKKWRNVKVGPVELMTDLNQIRLSNYKLLHKSPGCHLSYLEKDVEDVLLKHESSAHVEISIDKIFLQQILRFASDYQVDHLGRFDSMTFGLIQVLNRNELNFLQREFLDISPEYFSFERCKFSLPRRISASRQITNAWEMHQLDMLAPFIAKTDIYTVFIDNLFAFAQTSRKIFSFIRREVSKNFMKLYFH